MTVIMKPALPSAVQAPDTGHGDLDARILQAEQRLIAREEALHRSVRSLGKRMRQALRPRQLLIPAVCVGAVLSAVLWFGLRRRPAARPGPALAADAPPRRRGGAARWARRAGLLWPMLPVSWRARISPAWTDLVLSTGLPLLEHLLAPSRRPLRGAARPID
jgi:hypothetical protein